MSDEALVVTALGMVSALGLNAATACAAARAGISQATELKGLDLRNELFGEETRLGGNPVLYGHLVRGIADGFVGLGKALLHAGAAIDDLMAQRSLSVEQLSRTGLVVNLSNHAMLDLDATLRDDELPSLEWRDETQSFAERLADAKELALSAKHLVTIHGGRVGIVEALRKAESMIHSKGVDRCLVGAVDSLTEAGTLFAAARLHLLRTSQNPVGFIAGEAAAFILVERINDARHENIEALGTLGPTFTEMDSVGLLGAEGAPGGVALAAVLAKATERGEAFLIGDLNGTSRRAVEWGNALVRVQQRGSLDGVPLWIPAMSFGDTGAAAGAVGLCLALRGFARGYAPAPKAVVWLSSMGEAKGAVTAQRNRHLEAR